MQERMTNEVKAAITARERKVERFFFSLRCGIPVISTNLNKKNIGLKRDFLFLCSI